MIGFSAKLVNALVLLEAAGEVPHIDMSDEARNAYEEAGKYEQMVASITKIAAHALQRLRQVLGDNSINFSIVIEGDFDNGAMYGGKNQIIWSLDYPDESVPGWHHTEHAGMVDKKQVSYYLYQLFHELGHLVWREVLGRQKQRLFVDNLYSSHDLDDFFAKQKRPEHPGVFAYSNPRNLMSRADLDKFGVRHYKEDDPEKPWVRARPFVSDYASSDIEEEFCESFAFALMKRSPRNIQNLDALRAIGLNV